MSEQLSLWPDNPWEGLLSHPLRRAIFERALVSLIEPEELAREWEEPLDYIQHHCEELAKHGALEAMPSPTQGPVKHHYCATQRAIAWSKARKGQGPGTGEG